MFSADLRLFSSDHQECWWWLKPRRNVEILKWFQYSEFLLLCILLHYAVVSIIKSLISTEIHHKIEKSADKFWKVLDWKKNEKTRKNRRLSAERRELAFPTYDYNWFTHASCQWFIIYQKVHMNIGKWKKRKITTFRNFLAGVRKLQRIDHVSYNTISNWTLDEWYMINLLQFAKPMHACR